MNKTHKSSCLQFYNEIIYICYLLYQNICTIDVPEAPKIGHSVVAYETDGVRFAYSSKTNQPNYRLFLFHSAI